MANNDRGNASTPRSRGRAGKSKVSERGILVTLKEEHKEISHLMDKVMGTEDDEDVEARAELFEELKVMLLAHAAAEDKEFYPVLLRHDRTREAAERSTEGHEEVAELIERIESLDLESTEWMSVFLTLKDMVFDHVEEEEQELLPLARELLSQEELLEMGSRFVEQRDAELKAFM